MLRGPVCRPLRASSLPRSRVVPSTAACPRHSPVLLFIPPPPLCCRSMILAFLSFSRSFSPFTSLPLLYRSPLLFPLCLIPPSAPIPSSISFIVWLHRLIFVRLPPPPPLILWYGVPGGPPPALCHVPARELHPWPGFSGHLVADRRAGAIPQPAGHTTPPHRPYHLGEQEVHRPLLVPGLLAVCRRSAAARFVFMFCLCCVMGTLWPFLLCLNLCIKIFFCCVFLALRCYVRLQAVDFVFFPVDGRATR